MADNGGANSERPKREINPDKDIMGPPPIPKRRYTKAVKSKISLREEESKLETVTKAKGEGAAVSQDSSEKPMEKGRGPLVISLRKSIPSQLKEMAGGSACPSPLSSVYEDSPGCSRDWPLLKPSGNAVGQVKRIEFFTGHQTFLQLIQEVEYMKGRIRFAEYTISETIKELMAYETSKNSARPENEKYPVSVVMDRLSSPKHLSAGEGGSFLETTTDGKGKDVNSSEDDYEQHTEEDADNSEP